MAYVIQGNKANIGISGKINNMALAGKAVEPEPLIYANKLVGHQIFLFIYLFFGQKIFLFLCSLLCSLVYSFAPSYSL